MKLIQITIAVQILHIYTVDTCSREFLSRTEGFLNHTAVDNIF